MAHRVAAGTTRPSPITFTFDAVTVTGYPGETIAAALIASNIRGFRRDLHGGLRGPYCNMGTCFECILEVRDRMEGQGEGNDEFWRTVRACLTPVAAGLSARSISVAGPSDGEGA